uniref:Integrase n=1 Tax=Ascaris lumbricoides TaxID=6252 RepID=A0A0M3HYL5_ASCLU
MGTAFLYHRPKQDRKRTFSVAHAAKVSRRDWVKTKRISEWNILEACNMPVKSNQGCADAQQYRRRLLDVQHLAAAHEL